MKTGLRQSPENAFPSQRLLAQIMTRKLHSVWSRHVLILHFHVMMSFWHFNHDLRYRHDMFLKAAWNSNWDCLVLKWTHTTYTAFFKTEPLQKKQALEWGWSATLHLLNIIIDYWHIVCLKDERQHEDTSKRWSDKASEGAVMLFLTLWLHAEVRSTTAEQSSGKCNDNIKAPNYSHDNCSQCSL